MIVDSFLIFSCFLIHFLLIIVLMQLKFSQELILKVYVGSTPVRLGLLAAALIWILNKNLSLQLFLTALVSYFFFMSIEILYLLKFRIKFQKLTPKRN